MNRILVAPPTTLIRLMAVYCVWETDRRQGGRAVVVFQRDEGAPPPARDDCVVNDKNTVELAERARDINPRLRILLDHCRQQPPFPKGSLGEILEELRRKLKPTDERLWLAFLQIANRVLTGNHSLIYRGSREVLGQDQFFRQRLYPPPPHIAGVEIRHTQRYCVALVNAPNDHLVGRVLNGTPAAVVISRDPQTGGAQVQLRVHPWRAPLDLKRFQRLLPREERWQLAAHENQLLCSHTRHKPEELLRLLDQISYPL